MEKKNKILVTGGATGIGLGLTERFLQEGHTVIVCGRREQVLKELTDKFPTVITKQCDLENAADREALYTWISKQHADLNVLVNNAGIQNWMDISDENFYKKANDEITINVMAPKIYNSNAVWQIKIILQIINNYFQGQIRNHLLLNLYPK